MPYRIITQPNDCFIVQRAVADDWCQASIIYDNIEDARAYRDQLIEEETFIPEVNGDGNGNLYFVSNHLCGAGDRIYNGSVMNPYISLQEQLYRMEWIARMFMPPVVLSYMLYMMNEMERHNRIAHANVPKLYLAVRNG